MGRAPCCERMGMKKGPWTPEEDQILVNHIKLYGHSNWRALPKQAGLLRCGKSCRLRWMNYLRPDIKRGNFTKEEEETIIKLHQMLGNRWSAIAAKLKGRTDNEIKNVWHTHLKKRLTQENYTPILRRRSIELSKLNENEAAEEVSPQPSCSDISSARSYNHESDNVNDINNFDDNNNTESKEINTYEKVDPPEYFPEVDISFLSEVLPLSDENSDMGHDFSSLPVDWRPESPFSSIYMMEPVYGDSSSMHDNMDFWSDLFSRAEEPFEL